MNFDRDGSGTLSTAELEELVQAMTAGLLTPRQLAHFSVMVDPGATQALTRRQLLQAVKECAAVHRSIWPRPAAAREWGGSEGTEGLGGAAAEQLPPVEDVVGAVAAKLARRGAQLEDLFAVASEAEGDALSERGVLRLFQRLMPELSPTGQRILMSHLYAAVGEVGRRPNGEMTAMEVKQALAWYS